MSTGYGEFYFQDNTLISSLRCCNENSTCEVLQNTNKSTINAIEYCYEVGNERINVNIWDFMMNNWYLTFAIILGLVLFIYVIVQIKKR